MIVLFTDFGIEDFYLGQLRMVLERDAPGVPVIDYCHTVPNFDVKAGAYLLAAAAQTLPPGAVCVAVVDPGVGGVRDAMVLHADGRWFVGPDNGLLAVVMRRAADAECHKIVWRPTRMSVSFHGRDLFAPVAAMLATGRMPETESPHTAVNPDGWPAELPEIIYIDHYGNAFTGVRADRLDPAATLRVAGRTVRFAETFSAVEAGQGFWYGNSVGLVEIAVNRGNAAQQLGVGLGDPVEILN